MSLKDTLTNAIKEGYKTLDELYALRGIHKIGTVDRILRGIVEHDNDVEVVKNLKGFIVAYSYKWKPKDLDVRFNALLKKHATFGDPIYLELKRAKPDWVKENLLKKYNH